MHEIRQRYQSVKIWLSSIVVCVVKSIIKAPLSGSAAVEESDKRIFPALRFIHFALSVPKSSYAIPAASLLTNVNVESFVAMI